MPVGLVGAAGGGGAPGWRVTGGKRLISGFIDCLVFCLLLCGFGGLVSMNFVFATPYGVAFAGFICLVDHSVRLLTNGFLGRSML
jgi:hypothetical protein